MGRKVHYLPTCHSTNDFALKLLQNSVVKNGTIVISDFQSKGRGQRGNGWESQSGVNLLLSLILRPVSLPAHQQFRINILISNAIVTAIKDFLAIDVKIKWPNDIFYKQEKLAGVLIESMIQGNQLAYSIIGMGINVNQELFDTNRAISLKTVKRVEIDRVGLVESIIEKFEENFHPADETHLKNQKLQYMENLFAFNEWRSFEDHTGRFQGRIKGVTDLGEILIEREKGLSKYQMKEFRYIFESMEI